MELARIPDQNTRNGEQRDIVPRYSKGVKIAIGAVALLLAISVQAAGSDGCTRKYGDHNQVDYGPLRLSRVVGTAVDETGSPVAKTCVYLFTEKTHRLLASAEVDSHGKFSLQNIKAGSYRLVVASEGFCTANIPLSVVDRATHKRLVVHMKIGEIDVCSYGDYK